MAVGVKRLKVVLLIGASKGQRDDVVELRLTNRLDPLSTNRTLIVPVQDVKLIFR